MMQPLWHALAFLTRIPVPWVSSSKEDWLKSPAYYPLVGLIIGILLWLFANAAAHAMPGLLASVLAVAFWAFITGGLHLDGWMDLADGLGSNRPREQMLDIMKDSRVGAMGAIALLFLVLLKIAAVLHIQQTVPAWLLAAPLTARFTLLIAMKRLPYIAASGIGDGLQAGIRPAHLAIGGALVLAVAAFACGLAGAIAAAASLAVGLLFAVYVSGKLGGVTGDVYGAVVEFTETVGLLVFIWTWGMF